MAKFNTTATRPARGNGPIVAEATPSTATHEGGPGYVRDVKSELFLLAVANFVGEDSFYESADQRDNRYANLVRRAAVADPLWTAGFLRWLRGDGNMRSASLVGAAEFVKARLDTDCPAVQTADLRAFAGERGLERAVIDAVCQRADEPGEMLAYWTSKYGRAVPKPVKRGVADAVRRLYTEYALLKYDTASKGYRFADVIDLAHPTPQAPWQGDLFRHALDRRHNRGNVVDPELLPMITRNEVLRESAAEGRYASLLNPDELKAAGLTWEDVLSLLGSKVDKAKLWEALIPSMGIMALARNLRNFDEAGVSDEVAAVAAARFADPAQVAKSRMFPFRWLAAYEQAPSLRWSLPLDRALTASLANLPELNGRSLVLVDTSASMTSGGFSRRSTMTPAKAAAVFGVALAAKGQADLYGFADGTRPFRHDVPNGAGVVREIERFIKRTGEDGHGTNIAGALRATFSGHDRVFIISDMQTMGAANAYAYNSPHYGVTNAIPTNVPLYGFNLGGYRAAAFDAGNLNRIEFGGLTDATFRMVPLIEAGKRAAWPWLQ